METPEKKTFEIEFSGPVLRKARKFGNALKILCPTFTENALRKMGNFETLENSWVCAFRALRSEEFENFETLEKFLSPNLSDPAFRKDQKRGNARKLVEPELS